MTRPTLTRAAGFLALALLGGSAMGQQGGTSFELRDFPEPVAQGAAVSSGFPIEYVVDDGSAEGVFGLIGSEARQFLWFTRFSGVSTPFVLNQIQVLFPLGTDAPVGGDIQLVVYSDPDGDPTNGAMLLAAIDETVQVADGLNFSVYDLPNGVPVEAGGDILVGVVSRFFRTGVDPSPTRPAALDTTNSQNRAWFALWPGDPPDPPSDLTSAETVERVGLTVSGNWMIRAFASPLPINVPTLSPLGLGLLLILLAVVGGWFATRMR